MKRMNCSTRPASNEHAAPLVQAADRRRGRHRVGVGTRTVIASKVSTIAAIVPIMPISSPRSRLDSRCRRAARGAASATRGSSSGMPGGRAQDLDRIVDVQLRLLELLGVSRRASRAALRQPHFADVLQQAEVAEQLDLRPPRAAGSGRTPSCRSRRRASARPSYSPFLRSCARSSIASGLRSTLLGQVLTATRTRSASSVRPTRTRLKRLLHQSLAAGVRGARSAELLLDARLLGVEHVLPKYRMPGRGASAERGAALAVDDDGLAVFLRASRAAARSQSTKPWKRNGVSVHGRSSSATYMPKRSSDTGTLFSTLTPPGS